MVPTAAVPRPADKRQSLELIRIIITTTFSHVLWHRRIFPEIRYNFKTCDPADPDTSYDAFIDNAKSTGAMSYEPTNGLTSWAILPRHVNKDADKLLNHLENGVKEALENGSLSKLQLSFHTPDEPPSTENIFESYTLGFHYKDGISLAEITAEGRNSNVGSRSFLIGDIKEQMDYMLTEINHIIINHERSRVAKKLSLPKAFRMLLTMKYVGIEGYRPFGFHRGGKDLVALIDETPLDLNLMMTTGQHSILAGMVLLQGLATHHSQEARIRQVAPALLPADPPEDVRKASQDKPHRELSPNDTATQPQAVARIEAMGVVRIDDFNTQLIDSSPLHFQQSAHPLHSTQARDMTMTYTQDVLDYIEESQSRVLERNGNVSQQIDRYITCECQAGLSSIKPQRLDLQDGTMKCLACNGYCHCSCYGYTNVEVPEIFVCYSCLKIQFPDQKVQLHMVQSLCLKRRTLNHIFEMGSVMTISDIAVYLKCSNRKASELLSQLKVEGYITETSTSKRNRKSFISTGQKDKAIEKYFDPNTGMGAFKKFTRLGNVPVKDVKELNATIPEVASKELAQLSKTLMKQPRIFHAPNHLTITDDASTQGTPSPHPSLLAASDSFIPITPTGDRTKNVDFDTNVGSKRKADEKFDGLPAKRIIQVVSGTPWSLRRS